MRGNQHTERQGWQATTCGFVVGVAALIVCCAACGSSLTKTAGPAASATTATTNGSKATVPAQATTTTTAPAAPSTVVAVCGIDAGASVDVFNVSSGQTIFSGTRLGNYGTDVGTTCNADSFNSSFSEYATIGYTGSTGVASTPGCTTPPFLSNSEEGVCAGYLNASGNYTNVWSAPDTPNSFSGNWTQVIAVAFKPGTNTLYWLTDQENGNNISNDVTADLTLMSSEGTSTPVTLHQGSQSTCGAVVLVFNAQEQPLAEAESSCHNPWTNVPPPPGEQTLSQSSRQLPATSNSVGTIVQEAGSNAVAFVSGSDVWTQSAPGAAPVQVPGGTVSNIAYVTGSANVVYYGPDPQS